MTIEVINTGIFPNDETGDSLRVAYTKINQNFTQFAPVAFTGQYSSLLGTPSFARVAYTGLYSDVIGTPVLGLLAFLNTINNSNWFGIPLKINNGGTGQVTAPAAFDALSPMSQRGDLIYGQQNGAGFRLPVGANGQILSISNNVPSWVPQLQVPVLPPEVPDTSFVHYGTATGTNTLSTNVTPLITGYHDGIFIELLCSNYNTGPVTLNSNGLGPLPIVWPDGSPLASHSLIPGGVVYITFVGGSYQLVAGASPPTTPEDHIFNIQVFTNDGTYIPTTGAKRAVVFATGGGGAGGAYSTGGGGGGAGATAIAFLSLVGVSSVVCTIGVGGLGVPVPQGGTSDGNPGSPTSFGSYAVAGGGLGGSHPLFDFIDQNAAGGFGGEISAGLFGISGGDGGHGIGLSGTAGGIAGGVGGGSFWGGGGDGAATYTGQGSPGRAWGAGGGGANSSCSVRVGGDGKKGIIIVVEFS